jgi:uncharacterized protein (TIGR03790 family)
MVEMRCGWLVTAAAGGCIALRAWAGGSGLNVAVVVNQHSTNSVQLGNYYAEKRQVPPQNYIRINWAGGNIDWTNADFRTYLLNPVLGAIASRQLTNQIDYILLSMDIPYRVYQSGSSTTSGQNSTTAALFYGFKPDYVLPSNNPASCNLPPVSSNSYAGSESVFRFTPPGTAATNYMAMMITSWTLDQAKAVVDHGVAGDSSFSLQPVILGQSGDGDRNIRYQTFDNAIFNTRLRGNYNLIRLNVDEPIGYANLLGYQNGWMWFSTPPETFAPGALADNLTSYGGLLFEPSDHTNALAFLYAGASGSYGTVVEPCAYLQKFPSAQNYFYQSRGFSLAECYYQGITNPYQGILVGEPLSAAFALPPTGAGLVVPANALLSGTTNLSLQFSAADATRPLQQVDLFLDGIWLQTVTNIPPRQNNLLNFTIGGQPMSYLVPASATIKSVASGLTTLVNTYASTTKVIAIAHGDRVELQSTNMATPGSQISVAAGSLIGTAGALTTFLTSPSASCLDTIASGIRHFQVQSNSLPANWLQLVITTTNGVVTKVGATNTTGLTLAQLTQQLMAAVNSAPALSGPGGVTARDLVDHYWYSPPLAEFNLVPNSIGWAASQIQADLNSSSGLTLTPSGLVRLDPNVNDLRPRAHLYVTAGATNLSFVFPLNTTVLANGYHELTVVAYEGSHVRTQRRLAKTVLVQNGALAATFNLVSGASNATLNSTLQFSVAANTNVISKIELFSTGGLLLTVSGQQTAAFNVAGTNLGLGLHPFYAIVTASNGIQYRTETKWVRFVGVEPPFTLSITGPPPVLSWPATAGRSYIVLRAPTLTNSFSHVASFAPSNSPARWTDTNPPPGKGFYRVTTSY